MDYPEHIIEAADECAGKSIFYFLEIEIAEEIPVYKFGITCQSSSRIRTHCRSIGIRRVVALVDCEYDSVMRKVETEFKRYARAEGSMVTRLKNTEILVTNNIGMYVDMIKKMVAEELKKPQPKNIRGAKKYEVVVNVNDPRNANKTCMDCMKVFRTPAELQRHKNITIPCVITEIRSEDRSNPLRCNYCNKVFSKTNNLNQHYNRCKVKNGKITNLQDIVKHEEYMRIWLEEQDIKNKDIEARILQMRAEIDELKAQTKELRDKL